MAIAAATIPDSEAQSPGETVISAGCVLAIGTAMRMLQRDFLLNEQPPALQAGFNSTFQRHYAHVSCYEDAEGFVLNFRPSQYVTGGYGNGLYMVRMTPDHQVEYATPMR